VQQIRVLLASPPGVLRNVIEHAVAAQSDMRLVGEYEGRDSHAKTLSTKITELSASDRPDVVVVEREDERSVRLLEGLLYEHPWLAVLAVTGGGREAHLRVLRPHDETFDDVSPMGIVAAIRESRRPEMT
jgi:hypothetical protein